MVVQNINISPNCLVGAGSVVLKDIVKEGKYWGIPALKKDLFSLFTNNHTYNIL